MARKPNPLHVFLLCDVSGSMRGRAKKLQPGEVAVGLSLLLAGAEEKRDDLKFFMRVALFDETAHWHVREPTPVGRFTWRDLKSPPATLTCFGPILRLVTEQLQEGAMEAESSPPLVLLLSDGLATDVFSVELAELKASFHGGRAKFFAIPACPDSDFETLRDFCGAGPFVPLMPPDFFPLMTFFPAAPRGVETAPVTSKEPPGSPAPPDAGLKIEEGYAGDLAIGLPLFLDADSPEEGQDE